MRNAPEHDVTQDFPRRLVRRRLMWPLALTMVALIAGLSTALLLVQDRHIRTTTHRTLSAASEDVMFFQQQQTQLLAALLQTLSQDSNLLQLLEQQDRERLFQTFSPLFNRLREDDRITHFYFLTPERRTLLRVHMPERHGDLIERYTAKEAQRRDAVAAGIELGPLGTFTLRCVMPIKKDGRLIGFVELGKEIEDILNLVHQRLHVDCVVTVDKRLLKRTSWEQGMAMLGRQGCWPEGDEEVVIYSSREPCQGLCHQIRRAQPGETVSAADGTVWSCLTEPLADVSGQQVGHRVLFMDVTRTHQQFYRMFAAVVAISLALSALLLNYVYRSLRETDHTLLALQKDMANSQRLGQFYLSAIDDMGLGLIHIDQQFRVREINTTMKGWFGDIRGSFCHRGIFSSDQRCADCRLEEVMRTGTSHHCSMSLADGRVFEIASAPMTLAGESGIVEVFHDMTHEHQVRQQLEKLATTDALTGCANRRYGMELLEREVSKASRLALPLSCLVMDLDFFKQINDSFGHEAGDHALVELVKLFKRELRRYDILFRYGGEEFVLVFPGLSEEQALGCAERLRRQCAEQEIVVAGTSNLKMTVSGGLAAFHSGELPEELIRRADAALYQAKKSGRNRICLAPTLDAKGE
ncbi:MAG: diguanylate cyclase [Desulfuromonadaceae bacterium]|nr:diguanylate cyclase [Desulfuromonadaceae bacterium]